MMVLGCTYLDEFVLNNYGGVSQEVHRHSAGRTRIIFGSECFLY